MAALEFNVDLTIDGESFPSARGQQGERAVAVTYQPKIRAASQTPSGDATLDPIEYITYHRGSGASRSVGVRGMVGYSENAWTVDPGLLMPGPEVTSVALTGATVAPRPDAVAEADGSIFVIAGRYVFKLSGGQGFSPLPSQDLDLGVNRVGYALKRFGTSVFLSSDANLAERPDGGGWTSNVLGGVGVAPTGALGTVWWTTGAAGNQVTAQRLVAQFGQTSIRYCATAPRLDSNWTPGLNLPAIDIGAPITRFTSAQDHMYIATDRGLRDLDVSGLSPNLIPEAELEVLPSGGLAALIKTGRGYCSAGYDLYRVTLTGVNAGQGEVVTPMSLLPNESPAGGYGTALLSRGPYLIYAMYDAVNDVTWICWGRDADTGALIGRGLGDPLASETIRGPEVGPMVWNVAPIVLRGFRVTSLWISGLASDGPRLWMFGTGPKAAPFVSAKWAPLAYTTPYADLQGGRARRFAQNCFTILPSEDGGEDAILKDVEEIQHEGENMGGGNSVRLSAAKEGDKTFTPLATFTTGPRLVQEVSPAFVSQRPTFRLDLTGTPLSPPISRRTTVRWLANPDVREVRKYTLLLGRGERFGSGSRVNRGADEQTSHLVALARAAARVTMTDETGVAIIVRILKVEGPSEVEAAVGDERLLTLAVTLSIFANAPGASFGYDAGIGWDTGHKWT